jgi:hypothetical protein
MKSRWLSAAFLAVAMAVSACGGMEENVEPTQGPDSGIRESQARNNTEDGSGTPSTSSFDGTCHENCSMGCVELYPNDPHMFDRCTWSCIAQECGGGPYP